MCSTKCAMPVCSTGSCRDPRVSHTPTATDRTCGIRSVARRTPLARTARRMLDSGTWRPAAVKWLQQKELPFNHITAANQGHRPVSPKALSAEADDADSIQTRATDDADYTDQTQPDATLTAVTPYHAKFWAYELTRRAPSDSVDRLANALVD